MAVIWSLWRERNASFFHGTTSHLQVLVERAKFFVASWVGDVPQFRDFSMDFILFKWKEVAFEEGE